MRSSRAKENSIWEKYVQKRYWGNVFKQTDKVDKHCSGKNLKDIERMCLNNLKKFIGSDMEKNCSKSFSNASNFLNIEEEK